MHIITFTDKKQIRDKLVAIDIDINIAHNIGFELEDLPCNPWAFSQTIISVIEMETENDPITRTMIFDSGKPIIDTLIDDSDFAQEALIIWKDLTAPWLERGGNSGYEGSL